MILKNLENKQRIYNNSLIHGKKKTTEKNLIKSFKKLQKSSKKNHIKVVLVAIKNLTPALKMNKQKIKKRKKKMYKDIPVVVKKKGNRINLAIKFIVTNSLLKKETTSFFNKFYNEILDSASLKSVTFNNKTEIQKQIILKKKCFQDFDGKGKKLLRLIGLEPITFGTEIQRSIQLSYKRFIKIK